MSLLKITREMLSMSKKLFSLYELMILRRPLITLLVTVLILGWLASHLPNFKLDASADSLVLEGDKDLEYSRQITKRYGSEEFLLVGYR
jgi:predicted RND superfamily exporter protein